MGTHDGCPLPTVSQVSEGHYTVGGGATLLMEAVITTTADTIVVAGNNETTAEQVEADTSLTSTRSAERLCEPGFWCEAGFRYPCEAGAYGSDFGATRGNCSGRCKAGFVCRNGSVSPEENPCGVSVSVAGGNRLGSTPEVVNVGRRRPCDVSDHFPRMPGRGFDVVTLKHAYGIHPALSNRRVFS